MIRFACSNCRKVLRIPEDRAGTIGKCPACGNRIKVPEIEAEAVAVDEEEPQPAPRRKKKRRRSEALSPEAEEGKQYVIFIGCALLGLHLVGMIVPMLLPSPAAKITASLPDFRRNMPKDFSKDFAKQMEELQHQLRATQAESPIGSMAWTSAVWMMPGLALYVVLFVFLYLRHDWARLVLGIVLLIFGFLGLVGLVMGSFSLFRWMSGSWIAYMVIYSLVSLAVYFGAGSALLRNGSIAAYTASR
jgi:hypothetical protein